MLKWEGENKSQRTESFFQKSMPAVVVHLLSRVWLFVTPWTAAPSPRVCSDSCPLSRWCHLTVLSSVTPFSSCLQPFPASEKAFPMSQLFTWSGQSIGASASASVLPMNIQGWFPLGLTVLISLLSKGLVKHQKRVAASQWPPSTFQEGLGLLLRLWPPLICHQRGKKKKLKHYNH